MMKQINISNNFSLKALKKSSDLSLIILIYCTANVIKSI